MAAPSVDDLTARYSSELLPFLRQDEFYASILLPSLISNQKGVRRAILNRHASLLFKTWALSAPESALALKRKASEILPGLLTHALADGSSLQAFTSFNRRLAESLFRFCIWSGKDVEALELARGLNEKASIFVRRGALLVQASNPRLMSLPGTTGRGTALPPDGRIRELPALFAGDLPGGRSLPGESPSFSDLFFRLFESDDMPGLSHRLEQVFGDVAGAAERRSTEAYLVWAVLAFASSGRLFRALRLAGRCRRGRALNRTSAFFHEEALRWISAAERYGLYRKWQPAPDESSTWRGAESQFLYGVDHARRMAEVLNIEQQVVGFSPPPDSPEGLIRSCHERFEELLLQPAPWLIEGAMFLLSYAGWDLRARILLSIIYARDAPEQALAYLSADGFTPLVQYRAMLMGRRLPAASMAGREKRSRNLKKMLEGSLGLHDPGA